MKDWTESERERQAAVLARKSVVANVRKGADDMLVAWAKSEGRFVYIGRRVRDIWPESDWANPFKENKHGDRAQIIAAYREHLEHSPALKMRLPECAARCSAVGATHYRATATCFARGSVNQPETLHGIYVPSSGFALGQASRVDATTSAAAGG